MRGDSKAGVGPGTSFRWGFCFQHLTSAKLLKSLYSASKDLRLEPSGFPRTTTSWHALRKGSPAGLLGFGATCCQRGVPRGTPRFEGGLTNSYGNADDKNLRDESGVACVLARPTLRIM
jgi:hypothetical protein